MHARDFVYWLQGFFEVTAANDNDPKSAPVPLSARQVACIQKHLAMVFIHEIDPAMGDKAHQAALTAAHSGGAAGTPPKPDTTCSAPSFSVSQPVPPVAIPKC